LEAGDFEFGQHLQNLWLDSNRLLFVFFHFLVHVRGESLFCFRISEIATPTFEDLKSLEWLNLNYNKLQILPYELVEPVLDTVKRISLYRNPLLCDCEMSWYKRWYEGYWQRIDTNYIKDARCLWPEDNSEHDMKVCQKLKVEKEKGLIRISSMWTLKSFSARQRQPAGRSPILLLPLLILLFK